MNTPIADFTGRYGKSGALRFHMPGHKGRAFLGCEGIDLTEITGADSLYEAEGIIAKSEANASSLFNCPTFYSAEGSSQCIRAMLYLALMDAKLKGRPCRILAARNVHKTFVSAAALLDIDVCWFYGESGSYLSCPVSPDALRAEILREKPSAVYLTSPDYLGNIQPVREIAEICHELGVILLVDNAHGAYLKFLMPDQHPVSLGADICCDSAHKTLPVLTGGAYLHLNPAISGEIKALAKQALLLFGSTSPSYLILQSLDLANAYLADGYAEKLRNFTLKCSALADSLKDCGYTLIGSEAMKLSIDAKAYGYTGFELQDILEKQNIFVEFADPDYLVLMLSCENSPQELELLRKALCAVPKRSPVLSRCPRSFKAESVLSIRQASLALSREVPVEDSVGEILAAASVGCPPAVPVLVCGERITPEAVSVFKYYGIHRLRIVT